MRKDYVIRFFDNHHLLYGLQTSDLKYIAACPGEYIAACPGE
jgi:hypothetical protein